MAVGIFIFEVVIRSIYLQETGTLKITDTLNVYPQAINRDCCGKNHQSGAQKHWDTLIIKLLSFYIITLLLYTY
mgnify:CR=1 FL=1